MAELSNYPLDSIKAFYLATLGSAQAMGIADKIGSLQPGREADFVALGPKATPLLAHRTARVDDIEEELLFVLAVMGDDRTVRATYVAGSLAHDRDATTG
ncbi:amidohydrolase family protein [Streptomyces sp. MJM1172]|uniref:amidohydrolase family protein n=1 Tax=Streptomyces sp. MJM1172 TaxID=1703926 RepID=UPI000AEB7755|nr:amidohydrolase family protein [Streptomyces sp. MJM1172]